MIPDRITTYSIFSTQQNTIITSVYVHEILIEPDDNTFLRYSALTYISLCVNKRLY